MLHAMLQYTPSTLNSYYSTPHILHTPLGVKMVYSPPTPSPSHPSPPPPFPQSHTHKERKLRICNSILLYVYYMHFVCTPYGYAYNMHVLLNYAYEMVDIS